MDYKLSPMGERVNISTHTLHVIQRGHGKPTVVFEPALGAFALQWFKIQPRIAEMTSTLSYDRAGQGWSDFSPHPRTPEYMTQELHQLLNTLKIDPPYLLVAHSFGGLLSRYYAQAYPDDVLGVVLIDTSHPMQYEKIKNFDNIRRNMGYMLKVLSFISRWGFLGQQFARFSLKEIREDVPDDVWKQLVYIAGLPKHHQTVGLEFEYFEQFFGSNSHIPKDLGNLPLTVITAAESILHQPAVGGFSAQELNDAHLEMQAEMAKMSTNSQHIIVPKATHFSILSHDAYVKIIVEAIEDMLSLA